MSKSKPCSGCALTPGAAANLEPENHLTARICVLGAMPFWCHDQVDWQRPMTNAEKRIEVRANNAPICQGWKREVGKMHERGYYRTHRDARRAFALLALNQLQILQSKKAKKRDKIEARKGLKFYLNELANLALKKRQPTNAEIIGVRNG